MQKYDDLKNDIAQAKSNDIEAKERIVKRYEKYVFKIAHNFEKNYEFDEAVSIGYMTILKCIDSYSTDYKNFTVYVTRAIQNNILCAMQQERAKTRLNKEIDYTIASNTDIFNDFNIKTAVGQLDAEEQLIVQYLFYHGYTAQQVADKLHISYYSVRYKKDRILHKLYNYLN